LWTKTDFDFKFIDLLAIIDVSLIRPDPEHCFVLASHIGTRIRLAESCLILAHRVSDPRLFHADPGPGFEIFADPDPGL